MMLTPNTALTPSTRRRRPRQRMTSCVAIAFFMTVVPLSSMAFMLRPNHHTTARRRATTLLIPQQAPATIPQARAKGVLSATSRQMMVTSSQEEVSEFELSVGRALDTLRRDYPYLLTQPPDFKIYDRDIEVVDPSGVRVHGLRTYQNSFRLLHAIVKVIYCPERSEMTFRMCYDKARRNIRCSWNARVVPREFFGGVHSTLHVDGISVYELDQESGNITQHRIEQLLINNVPVQPKEGVIAALEDQHTMTVPSFARNQIVQFQMPGAALGGGAKLPSSLFAMEASGREHVSASSDSNNDQPDFDWDALERKNKSRKKFGMKPLTPEEFTELEAQVQQMAAQQRQQHQASLLASSAAEMNNKKENFLQKLFGDALQNTCESNFDCERPEICCDFGFKKMCCASGTPVGASSIPQYALIPVPVEIRDNYPPPGNYDW